MINNKAKVLSIRPVQDLNPAIGPTTSGQLRKDLSYIRKQIASTKERIRLEQLIFQNQKRLDQLLIKLYDLHEKNNP